MEQHIRTYKIWTITISKVKDKYYSEVFLNDAQLDFSQQWKYLKVEEIFQEIKNCCDNLKAFKQLAGAILK